MIKTGADGTRSAAALLVEERETLILLGVLDQARVGVAIVQDRVVKFGNRAMREMYGDDLGEMMGMPFVELIAPASRSAVVIQHELRLKSEPFSTL